MVKNCPFCGKKIRESEQICPFCQTDYNAYMQEVQNTDSPMGNPPLQRAPGRKASKGILFFLLGIGMLLAVVAAVLIFIRKDGDETEGADRNPMGLTGVYVGDDLDMLLIEENGYATYFCSMPEYGESACPWRYENGRLEIDMTKYHTTLWAEISETEPDMILLRSDTDNWNDELFKRKELSADEMKKRQIVLPGKGVRQREDGNMAAQIGGFEFTIPKHYINLAEERENAVVFCDTDSENSSVAGMLFLLVGDALDGDEDSYKAHAESFLAGFLNSGYAVTGVGHGQICGREAYFADFTGILRSTFGGLAGYPMEGRLYSIACEDGSMVNVMYEQTQGGSLDNMDEFEKIIREAVLN